MVKWLKIADSSTNLLLHLVNDTLDYFQIKSGKFDLKLSTFSVGDLIESAFGLVSI